MSINKLIYHEYIHLSLLINNLINYRANYRLSYQRISRIHFLLVTFIALNIHNSFCIMAKQGINPKVLYLN